MFIILVSDVKPPPVDELIIGIIVESRVQENLLKRNMLEYEMFQPLWNSRLKSRSRHNYKTTGGGSLIRFSRSHPRMLFRQYYVLL